MAGDHLATRILTVIIITHIVFQYLSTILDAYVGAIRCDRADFAQYPQSCCAVRNCTTGAFILPVEEHPVHANSSAFEQLAGTAASYGVVLGENIEGFFRFMPVFLPILIANAYAHKLWAVRRVAAAAGLWSNVSLPGLPVYSSHSYGALCV